MKVMLQQELPPILQQELFRELHASIGVAELDISFIFKTNQTNKKTKKTLYVFGFFAKRQSSESAQKQQTRRHLERQQRRHTRTP